MRKMQYARSIISAGSRSGTWKTVNRGLARIRRDAPKRPTPEMLEAYSKAAAMPNPHEGFVNQADKVMKEMRAKVKETTDRHSSTFIKEGDIEENNSWNWVPPREEGREDDEVIPIKRG